MRRLAVADLASPSFSMLSRKALPALANENPDYFELRTENDREIDQTDLLYHGE
jgi:hypothetical protein